VKTIKTLGIATAVALALIAVVGASGASANIFMSTISSTNWQGSKLGSSHKLWLNEETFTCKNVSFNGNMAGATADQVTVSPELSSCTLNGSSSGWAMHGCKYRFNTGKGLSGTIDIVGCESPMSTNNSGCEVKIGNQSGIGTVEYKNAGSPETIIAVANLNSITFTRTGGVACAGPSGTFHNGTYTGEWTIKGSSAEGFQVSIRFELTSPTPDTVFAAEEAPVTITGSYNGGLSKKMTLGPAGFLNCEGETLSGTASEVKSAAITVTPSYHGCKFANVSIPDEFVHMGGCSYVIHVNGKFDIAGANCASDPITVTRPGCVAAIGPQSGLTTSAYFTNEGSGRLRTVAIFGTLGSGAAATAYGPSCGTEGAFTANIWSQARLSATNSSGELQGISRE
jgi:hypothetical protein